MISVYPRKQLDFSYSDILKALLMSFNFKRIKENPIKKIEELWPKENAIVGLSVRTILDTLLTLKNFTPGSEVLMSAINIPDMVDIIESHGLKIISIDIDLETLQCNEKEVNKAINDKTVMVLIAHLFGSRMEMEPIYNALKKHPHIFIFEDCAQAFEGVNGYIGGHKTDLSVFSFGSIKSITALGGAIGFTKNFTLKLEMIKLLIQNKKNTDNEFRVKIFKYIGLKLLSNELVYGIFILVCRFLKIDYDQLIISSVRMVKGESLFYTIRKRLPLSQIRYLLYRLKSTKNDHFKKQIDTGNYVHSKLKKSMVHGLRNKTKKYWLFPIQTKHRRSIVSSLLKSGFDATFSSTQLITIKSTDRVYKIPRNCKKFMSEIVYLPVYGTIPKHRLDVLVSVLNGRATP